MTFSVSPRVGEALPVDLAEDPVDESEGEASILIRRPNSILGKYQFQLRAGVVASPQHFDDQDPSSSIFGEVTIGDTYRTLGELTMQQPGDVSLNVADAYRPYLRYKYTRNYADFLQAWARDDHTITAGVRYRDVRTIMCDSEMAPATEVGACSDLPGVYLEVRAELNQTFSTDIGYRRLFPSVRIDGYSRPFWGGVRFFAWAQYEASFFEDERTIEGDARHDGRLRATAGFDLSGLVRRAVPGLEFTLAGQFQRRWSNNPDKRHERGYFIPAVSLSTSF